MGNVDWSSIDEINDVQAVNYYKELVSKGKNKDKAFRRAATGTRDNSRSPFQWSDSENAGFTTGKPWLKINSEYRRVNAEDEERRSDSVLNFFKKAIAFRKITRLLFTENLYLFLMSKTCLLFYREYGDENIMLSSI